MINKINENNITKIHIKINNNYVINLLMRNKIEINSLIQVYFFIANHIKNKNVYINSAKNITNVQYDGYINTISPKISNYINLKLLNLSNNKLKYIPDVIFDLKNLEILNLKNNMIYTISDKICNLKKLEILNLENNNLNNLNFFANKMPALVKLNLNYNKIEYINDNIENLESIKKIKLNNNTIKNISSKIENLNNLEILYINNSINSFYTATIVNNIFKIKSLVRLELNSNNIYSSIINLNILQLTNLKTLALKNNKLTNISEYVFNLPKLENLNLENNLLITLPNNINNLVNILKNLNISNNQYLIFLPNTLLQFNRNNIAIDFINTPLLLNSLNLNINIPMRRFLYNYHLIFDDFDDEEELNITTYDDNENTHNSSIQQTMRESITNLINNELETISKEDLIEQTKILNFGERLIVYINSIDKLNNNWSFYDVFSKIWIRINKSAYKDELIKILKDELNEGFKHCFTGMITRIMNSLCGFYDDIKINISDNDQISNIIITYLKDKEMNDYYRGELFIILSERGFNTKDIEKWLNNL